MEIRIDPIFTELLSVWCAVCEDVRNLIIAGADWNEIEPLATDVAERLIMPEYQAVYVRLAKRAYDKYEKELFE